MESLDRDDATDPESAESFALIPGLKAHLHNTTLEHLLDDPEVELIEADCFVRLGAAQSHPSWHLDRSDSCSPQCNEPPFDQAYDYGLADGRGAWVYVLDTGIRTSHSEFGGRASGGYSPKCFEWASSHCTHNGGKYAYEGIITDAVNAEASAALGLDRCSQHGTHCASTVAGQRYGMAKGARIISVGVLDCAGDGFVSDVVSGIQWATRHAQQHAHVATSVLSLSLGERRLCWTPAASTH